MAEHGRQITPGATRAHDSKHPLDEHTIVATRRPALIRTADDQTRYPLPLPIVEHQPIHDAQGRLPKRSLESCFMPIENPESPHNLVVFPQSDRKHTDREATGRADLCQNAYQLPPYCARRVPLLV